VDRVRAWLKFAGKNDDKVAAVFGISPEQCHKAVQYLSRGLPGIPIKLFTTQEPGTITRSLCDRVIIEEDSLTLLVTAEKELWPNRVVLSLSAWTGEHGKWPVKLAPFLIPPFRALFMNEQADFFPRTHIKMHAARRLRDGATWLANRANDINRGIWLVVFSQIAQRCAPLSRKVFQIRLAGGRKRHTGPFTARRDWSIGECWSGRKRLQPFFFRDSQEEAVGEILILPYKARWWNYKDLVTHIAHTQATHILLQQTPSTDDLQDLRALLNDSQTFAVSRQPAYRLWHPTVIPTAPFRRLQPGTATAALAPISPSILIDRAKLLALGGLPHAVVPGTALRLLFWKAAAAGWISYSGGGTQVLDEIADEPYEEAEFVVRVLSDPTLKFPSPQSADLSRGNITFQIAARPHYAPDKPRILVVSPYLPFPLSHGGAVRIYNLCRSLSTKADLLLATFRESTDHIYFDNLHEVFQEVYVVDIDERPSKDRTLPAQVRGHVSKSMRALIACLCESRTIDLLQIEFTHLADFRDAAPHIPAILVEHDLTFTLYQQLAEQQGTHAAQAEFERWRAFERRALRSYDAIWTMSEQDQARAIEEGSPKHRTYVVPNGVDIERFQPANQPTQSPEIFYVGSFRHLPNILGFERLRHEIMPRVWAKFPQAILRVVAGPDPERYWKEFQHRDYPTPDARIHLHAFVEDLRPLYAKAQVVVIPLLVSAGTNIKVLEAMACQKAVVSTPIGCAGLGLTDGEDAIIRQDSALIAEAISELLAEPGRREQIGIRARRTVEQRFSWEAIATAAYETYQQTMAGVTAR
jgi:glycosyltransferase involved in cell wall biosynthesis